MNCFQGYTGVVSMLVEFSTKSNPSSNIVNSVTASGSTALHIAVNNKDTQLIRYLLTRQVS